MRKSQWVVGVLLVGVSLVPMAASAATALEGTKWQVTVTPDAAAKKAGEKASKDTLIFKNGHMTSTACVKYGFSATPYTATASGQGASFQTTQSSKKEGTMVWSGQAVGNTISGTTMWTKKNGEMLHYQFSGKKTSKS